MAISRKNFRRVIECVDGSLVVNAEKLHGLDVDSTLIWLCVGFQNLNAAKVTPMIQKNLDSFQSYLEGVNKCVAQLDVRNVAMQLGLDVANISRRPWPHLLKINYVNAMVNFLIGYRRISGK